MFCVRLAGEEVVIEGEQQRAARAKEGALLLNNLCATYGLDKQVRLEEIVEEI